MIEKSGVEKFMVEKSGVEKSGVGKFMVESPGLKGLGLKLGVEKSGVEMSFNHLYILFPSNYSKKIWTKTRSFC